MNQIIKKTAILGFVSFIGLGMVSAQDGHHNYEHRKMTTEFIESLSDDQKEQLENHKKINKANHEAIKATYSEEQLAISNNPDLSMHEKFQAIKNTFTVSQEELVKQQREQMREEKRKFRETLTEDQKKQIKSKSDKMRKRVKNHKKKNCTK